MLVAVASTDGETVNQPFGKAPQFLIYEVEDDNMAYKETRISNPRSGSCNGQEKSHLPIDDIIIQLSGCDAVITAKFGIGAYNELMKNGIHPFQTKDTIEGAVKGYLKYKRAEAKVDRKTER